MNFSLQQMAAALGGEVRGREVLAPGPGHSHKDRSLAIRLDPRAPDGFVVHSFSGDDPLASKDYVRDKLGIRWEPKQRGSSSASIVRMQDRVSGQSVERPQVAEYIYKMEDGTPYLRVKRTPDKQFYQSHWTGSSWMNGALMGPKIPYRLPEIREAEHETVLIVEGEKDVDNLAALGFVATTNAGGAEKWTEDLADYLRGRAVYILPDKDQPGERHAAQVTQTLAAVAREIRIVRLPGLPPKGDVSDWLSAGGTADELARLMEAAPKEAVAGIPTSLIVSSSEFLAGFVPPDYLFDGLIQRRFCYSLTAPTGHAKTAIGLLIAASKALGRAIGKHEVEPGRPWSGETTGQPAQSRARRRAGHRQAGETAQAWQAWPHSHSQRTRTRCAGRGRQRMSCATRHRSSLCSAKRQGWGRNARSQARRSAQFAR